MSGGQPATAPWQPIRLQSGEGLTLAGRDYAPAGGGPVEPGVAALCLPGLTRNARDFDTLARALAAGGKHRPRRVIALDFRGRGESGWDPDPARYTPMIELADTMAILDSLALSRFVSIGTSRGGIVTMLMAALNPGRLAGAVINDVGPVLAMDGLLRIKGYVGSGRPPATWADAVAAVRRTNELYFPRLGPDDWERFARRLFGEESAPGGSTRPTLAADPALAQTLEAVSPETPPATLWPGFEALAGVPVLAIRGTLTDLLTRETLAEMARRHPRLETLEVADEGHAPLLEDEPTIARIATFLARVDAQA